MNNDTYLLGEDPNQRIDPVTGKAFVASGEAMPSVMNAKLAGPAPRFSKHPADREGLAKSSPYTQDRPSMRTRPPESRPPTPEELLAQANAMLEANAAQHSAQLEMGPSTGKRDDAGGKLPDWLTRTMEDQE